MSNIETQKTKEETKLFEIPKEFTDATQNEAENLKEMSEKGLLLETTTNEGTKQYEKIIGRSDDIEQMQVVKNAWDFRVELVGNKNLKENERLKGMFFNDMDKPFANQFLYEMDQKYEIGRQDKTRVDWDKWAKSAERLFDKKKYDGQVEVMKTAFGPQQSKVLEQLMNKESKLFVPSTLGLPNLTGKEKPTREELINALRVKVAESGINIKNQEKIVQFIGNWHNTVIELPGKKQEKWVAMNVDDIPLALFPEGAPTETPKGDGTLPGGPPPEVPPPIRS